eukprot:8970575-Heterocapsa_arctica.AAC.1
MITSHPAQDWERVITAQARSTPEDAVEQVKFRAGRNGGRPWVKPGVLDTTFKAARARAAVSRLPPQQAELASLQVSINVQGIQTGSQETF